MQRPLRYDVTNIITRSKRATKESRSTPRHYRVKHKEPELTDQFRFLKFVEARGLEPLTLCLQSRCATNCAMPPPPPAHSIWNIRRSPRCFNSIRSPPRCSRTRHHPRPG